MIQKVPANVDSVTVDIPAEWWRNNLNVRFAWKSLQGRPYDYEVDCLNSDGAGRAHILTGWIPTKDTSISVAAKAGQRVCTFGVATYFTLFLNTGDPAALYWGFFGNSGNKPLKDIMAGTFNDFLSQYHVWQLGPQGASIDGESLVSFSEFQSASDLSSEITLPFRANKGGNTLSGLEGDVSVKNAKIWEGEVLVRDFVPCVKNGVAGFYDRVRGTFRSSKTEAEFTAGTAVIAVDDGDIVSWSDVRELRTGTVVVFK